MCYMKKDVRLEILEKFNVLNDEKSEIGANRWFFDKLYDVAKVRNSLLELVESDFIMFANMGKEDAIKFLRKDLNTEPSTNVDNLTEDDLNKRSYKRFKQKTGEYDKITEFRFHTTLKGVDYLEELNMFKNNN